MDDTDPEPWTEADTKGVATPPGTRRSDTDKLTQHETLLLYGLMQSRCAKCKTLVVRESEASGRAFNLGKRAHMVARSELGPRGDAQVPLESAATSATTSCSAAHAMTRSISTRRAGRLSACKVCAKTTSPGSQSARPRP